MNDIKRLKRIMDLCNRYNYLATKKDENPADIYYKLTDVDNTQWKRIGILENGYVVWEEVR